MPGPAKLVHVNEHFEQLKLLTLESPHEIVLMVLQSV